MQQRLAQRHAQGNLAQQRLAQQRLMQQSVAQQRLVQQQHPAQDAARILPLVRPVMAVPIPVPRAAPPRTNYQARPRPLPIIDLTGEGDMYEFGHQQGATMGHAV